MYKQFIVFISDGNLFIVYISDSIFFRKQQPRFNGNKDFKDFWIDYIVLQNMLSILLRNPLKGFERKENFEAQNLIWDINSLGFWYRFYFLILKVKI